MNDPIGRFLAVCNAFVGFKETRPNAGQVVDTFLASTGLKPGNPWCAAFVSFCGFRAFSVHQKTSRWPVPITAGCTVIAKWAKENNVLVNIGQAGDLVLFYYPSMGRFAHVGVLVSPVPNKPNAWITIEGNTSGDGSRDGWMVAKRERLIDPAKGHRFVRWVNALANSKGKT